MFSTADEGSRYRITNSMSLHIKGMLLEMRNVHNSGRMCDLIDNKEHVGGYGLPVASMLE